MELANENGLVSLHLEYGPLPVKKVKGILLISKAAGDFLLVSTAGIILDDD